jgi:hypothetical protein
MCAAVPLHTHEKRRTWRAVCGAANAAAPCSLRVSPLPAASGTRCFQSATTQGFLAVLGDVLQGRRCSKLLGLLLLGVAGPPVVDATLAFRHCCWEMPWAMAVDVHCVMGALALALGPGPALALSLRAAVAVKWSESAKMLLPHVWASVVANIRCIRHISKGAQNSGS